MKCPFCYSDDVRVIDTRELKSGFEIRRRRECLSCGKRFTTYERIEEHPILVVKKSGEREFFKRDKLMAGIQKACEKRPVSVSVIDKIVDKIEYTLFQLGKREVSSVTIGQMVMDELKKIDQVAYVRFASVYKEFKDVEEFLIELESLKEKRRKGGGEK